MRTAILLTTLLTVSMFPDDLKPAKPELNVDGVISLKRFQEISDQYRDDTALLIGVVSYKSHFKGRYKDAVGMYESMAFYDLQKVLVAAENSESLSELPADAWLYLRRNQDRPLGANTFDVKSEEPRVAEDGKTLYLLARVKVSAKDKEHPELLEMTDFSVGSHVTNMWGPWKAKEQTEVADQHAKEFAKKEPLYWRDWKDSKGKTFNARYEKVISGEVFLRTKEGRTVKLKMSDLSDDEKQWLKDRPWEKWRKQSDDLKPDKPKE